MKGRKLQRLLEMKSDTTQELLRMDVAYVGDGKQQEVFMINGTVQAL